MKHLSNIARITTPAAMVVFLAYEISQSMAVDGLWRWLLLIGAFATAFGIEIVGILAGHALEGFWRLKDTWRSLLALALLAAYTATAVYILQENAAMVLVPIIAAIVYILAALTDGLEMSVSSEVTEAATRRDFELKQEAADREARREMERQRQADETAVKLARIGQKAAATSVARERLDRRSDSGQIAVTFPSDFRLLDTRQRHIVREITSAELQELAGISPSTARRWKRKVSANGHAGQGSEV